MWSAAGLLLVLAACAATSTATFPRECNKGPDYWCTNYRNAQECGAVGHCLQTVWTKQRYAFDSNPVAVKFTKLFDQLRHSHRTYDDERLQNALDAACRTIPHAAAGLKCKERLAGLAGDLKALLSSEMSSAAVCNVLALCNDDKMHRLMHTPKHQKPKKASHKVEKFKLLGSERCTWGPAYWCANFSNSHNCRATHHCVERVWSKTKVADDTDNICKICTDMVTQARDQLESNETQEELKQVFEGSCQLIPIKVVAKECMKLADDFVPELVETLASEMNPQQVCSVAGLCNSARIDKLIAKYEEMTALVSARRECGGCRRVAGLIRDKFDSTPYEQFLISLLKGCRGLSSFSDSCSTLVFTHYEDILSALQQHLNADSVCQVSGQCSYMQHSHADEYTFADDIVEVSAEVDDVPCELCEQLVKHLRDIVITNTTESEFYTVLKGICKQTGNFKDECLTLVEQWYPMLYNYLVSDLKPAELCALIGICPGLSAAAGDVPIAPLVPLELTVELVTPSSKLIGQHVYDKVPIAPPAHSELTVKTITPSSAVSSRDEYKTVVSGRVAVGSGAASVRVLGAEPFALPPERMFVSVPRGAAACTVCQYVLHYVQVEISDSRNEDEIQAAVNKVCGHLPSKYSDECKQFVEAYGPAVIALIVQEIDPASVCPALGLCPKTSEVRRVSINGDSSSCPLCLFAVEQLLSVLGNNKTEENIKHALENLCSHLSQKLKPQCVDFVDTYAAQLIDMVRADFNAKEICVYLKLCADTLPALAPQPESAIDKFHRKPHLRGDGNRIRKRPAAPVGVIATNEIRDTTFNGLPMPEQKSSCIICEFVMKEIDSEIKDKSNVDELKKIVHSICNKLPKSVQSECNQFTDKYADLIVSLLAQELDADQVCRELKLCDPSTLRQQVADGVVDCVVCRVVIMAVDKVVGNPEVDAKIVDVVEGACAVLPAKYNDRCRKMLEVYGDSIVRIIEQYGTKGACERLGLCGDDVGTRVQMLGSRNH